MKPYSPNGRIDDRRITNKHVEVADTPKQKKQEAISNSSQKTRKTSGLPPVHAGRNNRITRLQTPLALSRRLFR